MARENLAALTLTAPEFGPIASAGLAADASARFDALPLVQEGESKILRELAPGLVAIKFKPTIYSMSANRYESVEGTEALRLSASAILWQVLRDAGLSIGVLDVAHDCYVAPYVDAPPVETIVKAALVGTPVHLYHGITEHRTRDGLPLRIGAQHPAYVRFDWRNPLPHKDECMPLWLANRFIDIEAATETALAAFGALRSFLSKRRIEILDICFFIDASGRTIFGEVSPDCMRCKYLGSDLDKDLWRKGRSRAEVSDGWRQFLDLIAA
ncbi:hypothetical protein QA640_43625 [Bradyrhizobium sp. CB82]|uniref:phosphoribosylaminoimidazolesuccinocarboxamide synthase n=1 Tax=Bradyrhizobium sp. CB82 TaxID=3039159 RepID=UPI0024B1325E|nr:phosphoribosylaminoimidazolesuccinocarboxamide synthase [Bradyrhizobium sp. CB82]WFU40955.1 hypothetical protein QA640_43625 [Bradyrhizobium sp. CB82]